MLASATPVTQEDLRSYDQLGERPLRKSSALRCQIIRRNKRNKETYGLIFMKLGRGLLKFGAAR